MTSIARNLSIRVRCPPAGTAGAVLRNRSNASCKSRRRGETIALLYIDVDEFKANQPIRSDITSARNCSRVAGPAIPVLHPRMRPERAAGRRRIRRESDRPSRESRRAGIRPQAHPRGRSGNPIEAAFTASPQDASIGHRLAPQDVHQSRSVLKNEGVSRCTRQGPTAAATYPSSNRPMDPCAGQRLDGGLEIHYQPLAVEYRDQEQGVVNGVPRRCCAWRHPERPE